MASQFYNKYGFDVEVTIGSYILDTTLGFQENGLCDDLIVIANEGASRTATFSFIPPSGPIDLASLQGKKVKILQRNTSGWFQIFDGWVDIPSLEFMTGKITVDCSDHRQTRTEALAPGIVSSIGSYSEIVFGVSKDAAEELEKRLQTVAGAFDFDGYGNYRITPWLPKTSADFTLTPADIQYRSSPTISYSDREKVINTIDIQINYRYQRLHQQACHFTWTGFDDFISDYWQQGKPSFPAISTIDSAVHGGEWQVVSANGVTYVPLWPAQGFPYGSGYVMWQPNDVIEETKERKMFMGYLKDSSGNFITVGNPPRLKADYQTQLDANGKPILDVIKTTIIDNSSHLCRSASWTSARRFAQTVVENYAITMKAPQGRTINGVIPSSISFSIDDPYDTSNWEQGKEVSFTTQNFYVNKKINYTKLGQAIQVALNKARHDILNAHRDLTITFQTRNLKHRPEIDLHHTVDVTIDQSAIGKTKSIHAKGKVFGFRHVVDFSAPVAYTVITLKLSRASGSASNSTWAVLQPIEDASYIGSTNNITLKTHIALNPDTDPNFDTKTGWFCNAFPSNSDGSLSNKTTYAENFVIDFPEIPAMLRDEITYNSDGNIFDIVIPNDTFEAST